MSLRVLFDHQAFVLQRWGGISRYFAELIAGVSREAEVDLALARSLNEHVPALEALLGIRVGRGGFDETFLGGARFPLRRQLRSLAKRVHPSSDARRVNRRDALEKVRAGGFDLLHPTYYDPYFLGALGGRPFVLTVFDMTYEVMVEHFPRTDPLIAWKLDLARAAARIVAISANTKKDVVRLLGVDPERVDVIHLGFRAEPAGTPAHPAVPESYVLFTGTRASYKNWDGCVRALAPLLRDRAGLELVCTGEPFSRAERALLDSERIADRVRRVAADGRSLSSLYAGAQAFVFPSFYEGFGLPVLEAFAAGCPVALATGSSLPEVGGDAAVYFDPGSAESMRAAVERLLADARLRRELAERGRARVRAFTWERTVAQTLETYRRALGEGAAPAAGGAGA